MATGVILSTPRGFNESEHQHFGNNSETNSWYNEEFQRREQRTKVYTQTRNYEWGYMSSLFAPTQTSKDRTSNSTITNIKGENYNLLTMNLSPIAGTDRKITKEHMTR